MKTSKRQRWTIGCVIVLAMGVVVSNTLMAGNDRVSARTVGMARTFVASSRGLDALGLNPANLALDDRGSTVTFHVAPFGLRAGSDFINYQIYNDFFTGVDSAGKRVSKDLTEDDKNSILDLFPGGLSHTQFDFETTLFGLSIQSKVLGGIGFSVNERVGFNLDLPEDYLKFLLVGLPQNGIVYKLDNTAINASWVREFNLSYARVLPWEHKNLKEIAVGVGVKYVMGFAYFGTSRYKASIGTVPVMPGGTPGYDSIMFIGNVDFLQYRSSIPVDSVVDYIMDPAGTGIGLDFGVSAEVYQGLRVAVSVTNLGSITWNKNNRAIEGTGSFSITDPVRQYDTVKTAFKGRQFDTTEFTTDLPAALHFGASFQVDQAPFIKFFPGRLLVAADVHLGFNDEPGNSKTPRFSLGTEYRPVGALPIRTGFSFGGRERFTWSLGFGINTPIWDIDFATESIAILTNPESFRNGSFTMGMRFRI